MVRKTPSLAEQELAGLRYLVRHLNNDGGVPAVRPGDASGCWTTAEAMEAMLRSTWPIMQFQTPLERTARYLVGAQFGTETTACGGWPFVSGAAVASTMATAHAIISLSTCEKLVDSALRLQVDVTVANAVEWLLKHQDPTSGGWGVEPGIGTAGRKPRVVSTFLALRALIAAEHKLHSSVAVQRGVNFLRSMRLGDGFRAMPDAPDADVCSTVRAYMALHECGALERHEELLEAITTYIRNKKPRGRLWHLDTETYIPDGTSGQIIFNHNSTAEILEFLAAEGVEDELQRELVRWFSKNQDQDGSWHLGANDVHKREIITWPTSEAVLALGRYIRGADINAIKPVEEPVGHSGQKRGRGKRRDESGGYGIDIAVVCALEDVEFRAVKALDWNWKLEESANVDDSSSYFMGSVRTNRNKDVRAVAVAAPQMGMPAMAVLAMKVISRFRPKIIATVGIAAAVKPQPKINFGDVLFAEFSWDYGSGKLTVKDGKVSLSPEPRPLTVEPMIRKKFAKLKDNTLTLAAIKDAWPGTKPASSLTVHIGPVASGAAVVADTQILLDILDQQRKLIGIEMEIYSVFYAATHSSEPRPTPIAIKSVCDYGDRNKSDTYQPYAAYTSARVLDLFVREYMCEP